MDKDFQTEKTTWFCLPLSETNNVAYLLQHTVVLDNKFIAVELQKEEAINKPELLGNPIEKTADEQQQHIYCTRQYGGQKRIVNRIRLVEK
jgi:hypothetical protein